MNREATEEMSPDEDWQFRMYHCTDWDEGCHRLVEKKGYTCEKCAERISETSAASEILEA